jgi:hypothetical protein
MNASMGLASLLGRPGRGPRRPPCPTRCRPRVENLEGRLTPSFGDLLHVFHNRAQPPSTDTNFGSAVSLSGNSVLVSYPNENWADLFDATTGAELTPIPSGVVIIPPGGNPEWGLSPSAVSGDRVVIGEPRAAPGPGPVTSGSASVYDLAGNWLFTFREPTLLRTNLDLFGAAVAVSDHYVVVGAPGGNSGTGAAYLFSVTTGHLLQTFAGSAAGGLFGISVAVSGDSVVVGAPGENGMNGSAYVFSATVGGPPRYTWHNHSPTGSNLFGWSVAVSGTTAVVGSPGDSTGALGAGSAYVYDLSAGFGDPYRRTLNNPEPMGYAAFGWSVAVSGNSILVGAPNHAGDPLKQQSGSAYLFDAPSGARLATFADLPGVGMDHFGWSVAVSGSYALIGAPGDNWGFPSAGSAYLFDLTPNPPPPTPAAPQAPQPEPAAPAITARLVMAKVHKKRRLMVRVFYADTGAMKREFVSPYQQPACHNIHVSVRGDLVVVTARKGKRPMTAVYPG